MSRERKRYRCASCNAVFNSASKSKLKTCPICGRECKPTEEQSVAKSMPRIKKSVIELAVCYARTRERGEEYYKNHNVVFIDARKKSEVYATVKGSAPETTYNCVIKFRNGILSGYFCNCKAFEKYPGACKHIAAVMLELADMKTAGVNVLSRKEEETAGFSKSAALTEIPAPLKKEKFKKIDPDELEFYFEDEEDEDGGENEKYAPLNTKTSGIETTPGSAPETEPEYNSQKTTDEKQVKVWCGIVLAVTIGIILLGGIIGAISGEGFFTGAGAALLLVVILLIFIFK